MANQILKDDTFVIITTSLNEGYLGTNESKVDGNGFVQKAQISGHVEIPSVICEHTIIGMKTFAIRHCDLITSISLPETIKFLEFASFCDCNLLTSITFPGFLQIMGNNIDCFRKLETASFAKNSQISSIGDLFLRNSKELEKFVFTPTLTSIGSNAFENCNKLSTLIFCGDTDMSSISSAFINVPSTLVIFVFQNYKGTSFGGKPVYVVPFSRCLFNFQCKTFIQNNYFIHIHSLFVSFFISFSY